MLRLLQVFSFCAALFFLAFSTVYAEGEPGFIPGQLSPELQDSLNGTKGEEPTLQEVLDGLGFNIDVENDRLPIEVWVTIAGQYSQVLMAEIAGYGPHTSSGWYVAGSPNDTTVIFRGGNTPYDSAFFTISECDSHGLFIAPFTGEDDSIYYTEVSLNADGMDHAWVFCSGKGPNEFIVAWEDIYGLGDADFQDLVLLYRLPNRPPILSVPDDTSYDLCHPENICFGPINASDEDYCDTTFISMTSGPGTFEGDSCCFMPADVDSTYEFVFVATDWLGAADTQTAAIQVKVNQPPQLTCPEDDSINAGDLFISTDYVVTDPDDPGGVTVALHSISPTPTQAPILWFNHVRWQSKCADLINGPDFTITLIATDPCGAKDTCEFTVSVYREFIISAAPDTQYVVAGQAVGYEVKLTSLAGFADPCTLFVSGLPSPPDSGVFDKAILTPTDSTSLYVYTSTQTDTGWYTLTITAHSMSGAKPACLESSIEVYLKVQLGSDAGDWADNPNAPKSFALFQNQPNPFNPETHISYYLPKDCQVKLTIYNVLGQRVNILFDGHQHAGIQTLIWDGRDNHGAHLSSGIYFYRLQADDFHQTKKMTLMK